MTQRQFMIVVGLVSLQAGLLAFQAVVHSPCTDEPPQLVAGISHWQTGDFMLYRVTGPLARLVGAVPAMLLPHRIDWRGFDPRPGARPDDLVTSQYIKTHGKIILAQILLARLANIPFALLGGVVCFLWSYRLWGYHSGLLSLCLWTISPHVLGQGYLILTDIPGASLYVTTAYLYWRLLNKLDWFQVVRFGLVFGLLLLTKGSFLVSFGTWALIWVCWLSCHRDLGVCRSLSQIAAGFVVSFFVLNAVYGFEGSCSRLDSFQFVSNSLAGKICDPGEFDNRFKGTPLAALPVPVPKHYLLGLDVQKAYFDHGLRSYMNGEWRDRGWWHYYLYGYLLKTPIGTLILLGLSVVTWGVFRIRTISWGDTCCLIVPPIVMLLLVSSQTGFNKNLRYAYPALPFLHIVCGRVLAREGRWFGRLAWGLTIASLIESAAVFPHSLSFFNIAVGSRNGHQYLLHTNVDFGQDLYLLKSFLDHQPDGFNVAYYGFLHPNLIGIDADLPPSDRDEDWRGPRPGKYAVSVNLLHGHTYPVRGSGGQMFWPHQEQYTYFEHFEIDDFVGYSIAIFDLTEAEIQSSRAALGLPPLAVEEVHDAN